MAAGSKVNTQATIEKPKTGAARGSSDDPADRRRISRSLRDDRTVYIYGERVKDVTTHPAFRNTARMVARLYDALHDDKQPGQDHGADRHRQRRQDARLLQGAEDARGSAGRPRRHRRMGAHHLRLDRPLTRLQGRVPGDARRQRRVLRSVSGERAALVQVQPGARAVRQPRHHPSAGRSRPAAERGRPTSAATSRRRPTPASSSPAPRWWRPARC